MTEPNPKNLPRIHGKMLLKDLKAEVMARGMAAKGMNTKNKLVELLGLGSICISSTPQYKYVEKLRYLVEDEKRKQVSNELEVRQTDEAKEKAKKERVIQDKLIQLNESHKKLHTFVATTVHSCPLAPSKQLVAPHLKEGFVRSLNDLDSYLPNGSRAARSRCDFCRSHDCAWSCEECDFDICQICLEVQSLPNNQREKRRMELIAEEDDRIMQVALQKARQEKKKRQEWKEERRVKQKRQAKELEGQLGKFLAKHMDVPKGNRSLQGSGYTVWSSCGSRWDGTPSKHFDSSWKSLGDATQRAKYIFYIKNPWGLDASDVVNELDGIGDEEDEYAVSHGIKKSSTTNLLRLQTEPDDSDKWTVAVVPDQAFKYLDDVDDEPNHHDDASEDNGSVCLLAY